MDDKGNVADAYLQIPEEKPFQACQANSARAASSDSIEGGTTLAPSAVIDKAASTDPAVSRTQGRCAGSFRSEPSPLKPESLLNTAMPAQKARVAIRLIQRPANPALRCT